MKALEPPTLEEIYDARARIADAVYRTPLIPLNVDDAPARIYLKLENLQPIGSFKIRGAANAMRSIPPEKLADGVYTASAGNMAQGVALAARQMGVRCRVVVPDTAPRIKLDAIERLGAEIISVSYDRWWQVLMERGYNGIPGVFIHPTAERAVIAGNATIGAEIFEDLPRVDAVLAPYGGGGLACGIASAMRALKPDARVYPCESETAGPYAASLAAGKPVSVSPIPSFVDGIGGKSVLAEMWPMARSLLPVSLMASVAEISSAIRLLAERNKVIAEGAGAVAVALAMAAKGGTGNVVCIVSGGNIDPEKLKEILDGGVG